MDKIISVAVIDSPLTLAPKLQVQDVSLQWCTVRRLQRAEARGPRGPAPPGPTIPMPQAGPREQEPGQELEANPT